MAHNVVPEAEALLDQMMPVLDKGFVRLVDYMGGDARIVQSARVSYGEGTKTIREDKGLIDYLVRRHHTSPLEQVVLTFHLKMPIFVARQHIRHRMARANEMSGRYSIMRDEFYVPDGEQVRFQSRDNKQGRSEDEVPPELRQAILKGLAEEQAALYEGYEGWIEQGVARELARVNLPLSLYTEMYWQIDLHNLLHYLRLRMDKHAQHEIRVYGDAMAKAARAVAPFAFEAFEEHILHGRNMSRTEVDIMRCLIDEVGMERFNELVEESGLRKSRQKEFRAKILGD